MNDYGYKPLAIDEACEQPLPRRRGLLGKVDQVFEWLNARLPLILAPSPPPRGRRSAEHQLQSRQHFHTKSWLRLGSSEERVLPILKIIQREMDWPNDRFIPEDLVIFVFTPPDKYSLSNKIACHLIAEHLSIDFDLAELRQMIKDKCNLGQLVCLLLDRANSNLKCNVRCH